MSETENPQNENLQNENVQSEPFKSEFDDNKDTSASEPLVEGTPVQTDNSERDEDGEQDVSQEPGSSDEV